MRSEHVNFCSAAAIAQVDVNGPNTHPVYKFLKSHTPEDHGGHDDVEWNFAKWVVDKKVRRLDTTHMLFLKK